MNLFLFSKIKEKQEELNRLEKEIEESRHQLEEIKQKKYQAEVELSEAEGIIESQQLCLEYTPLSQCYTDLETQLNSVQKQISNLIATKRCINITKQYKIDNSTYKGEKFQVNYCKNLLTGFNSYFNKKAKAITKENYVHTEQLLRNSFNNFNKHGALLGVSISSEYFNLCIKELNLQLSIKVLKTQEKERIRKEKQILREQEQLLVEAEKERKRLEQEKKAMDTAFNKALTEEEREDIKNKLNEIDKRIQDVDYRINNQKAGYLYVCSSPSLPGLVKIGSTRRLVPMKRIYELSSSSVPEPFKAHCFVFSDDVFDLESKVHKYFTAERVNPNREFFEISPKEAIEVLKNKFDCNIYFNQEEEDNE